MKPLKNTSTVFVLSILFFFQSPVFCFKNPVLFFRVLFFVLEILFFFQSTVFIYKILFLKFGFRCLLELIPDNADYHRGLQEALGVHESSTNPLSAEVKSKLDTFYEDFEIRHPRCLTAKRISLDYLQGSEFKASAEDYIHDFLIKGIPSLFSDLKPLYKSKDKTDGLFEIFENFRQKLSQGEDQGQSCNPQCLLWVHHYLAQHFDSIGHTARALEHIQAAVDHTPTVAEIYVAQSKILKHAGDLPGMNF